MKRKAPELSHPIVIWIENSVTVVQLRGTGNIITIPAHISIEFICQHKETFHIFKFQVNFQILLSCENILPLIAQRGSGVDNIKQNRNNLSFWLQ